MAFLDLFKKNQEPEIKSINITASGLEISRAVLAIPGHIDAAVKLLGKPRKKSFKTNREELILADAGVTSKRVNYTWDNLGLYCYTNNGSVIHAFGIRISTDGDSYAYTPTNKFSGTVTIDGKPWFEVLSGAEDCDFFRKHVLGGYSIVSEYVDFGAAPESRTAEDFSSIEIQLD